MIVINLDKAKNIAHDLRRSARASEFAPLDIQATIPTKAAEAEAERQAIRAKYDALQEEINAAPDVAVLKAIVETL